MSALYPLISCICITRNKPSLLQTAINCFLSQSYPNKELIIIYENDDLSTVQFIAASNFDIQIKTIGLNRTPERKLGALRNYGIACATGTFIAQWDDDDWHHPDRLFEQYQLLTESGKAGCVMTRWLIFDAIAEKAFISNERLWEGSIVCRKYCFDEFQYENAGAGEDTAVIDALYSKGYLHLIEDQPHLYIYVYHGSNTWNYAHWSIIFKMGLPLPAKIGAYLSKIVHPETDVSQGKAIISELLAESKILIEDE